MTQKKALDRLLCRIIGFFMSYAMNSVVAKMKIILLPEEADKSRRRILLSLRGKPVLAEKR
ncbi:hypothetical protein [Herbaspirillum sp. RV1423]|uniref:hypothetical protein n=1 Tax=Herbaspirillum sp. RV1423 TaxID=1443993 RepID=UPI00055359E6|nr:hypothetical protein [Herbaspirillum sp. RV1423]